jgi:hypothetical protein
LHSIFLAKRQQLGGSRGHSGDVVEEYFNVLILIFVGGPYTVSSGWLRRYRPRLGFLGPFIGVILEKEKGRIY